MIGTIALIVALFLAALLLFAVEICTPMFGLLGAAALGCLAGMVYLCFGIDPTLGVVVIIGLLFVVPAYLWVAVKHLPDTFVGRVLQLRARKAAPGEGTPEAEAQKAWVGRTATAETVLRPSGAIRIDGKRVIATAEAGFIERGARVKVVKAVGMNVVVRKLPGAG